MIYKHGKYGKFYCFSCGIVQILDGLVAVLSLGFLCSNLTFSFCSWYTLRQLKKAK